MVKQEMRCEENEVMVRRRFLTPKVRLGHLATGKEVLAYVEKVNFGVLLILCVVSILGVFLFGTKEQLYGVCCGGVVALALFLISFFAARYHGESRLESALVQGGSYIVKFAVIMLFFFTVSRFGRNIIDVSAAAGLVILALIARLAFSSLVIVRTPVAVDVKKES